MRIGFLLLLSVQLVVPRTVHLMIHNQEYVIVLQTPIYAGQEGNPLHVVRAASTMRCPNGMIPGAILVDSAMTRSQQAKAMIHEVVHVAETCDARSLPVEERIAEDVSDLLDSYEGGFVLHVLAQR